MFLRAARGPNAGSAPARRGQLAQVEQEADGLVVVAGLLGQDEGFDAHPRLSSRPTSEARRFSRAFGLAAFLLRLLLSAAALGLLALALLPLPLAFLLFLAAITSARSSSSAKLRRGSPVAAAAFGRLLACSSRKRLCNSMPARGPSPWSSAKDRPPSRRLTTRTQEA